MVVEIMAKIIITSEDPNFTMPSQKVAQALEEKINKGKMRMKLDDEHWAIVKIYPQ